MFFRVSKLHYLIALFGSATLLTLITFDSKSLKANNYISFDIFNNKSDSRTGSNQQFLVKLLEKAFEKESDSDEDSSSKDRPIKKWPRLEIVLPVQPTDEGISEYGLYFLSSYSFFWPIRESKTSLLLITDEEKVNTSNVVEKLKAVTKEKNSRPNVEMPFRIALNTKPETLKIVDGHSRQQWLMLWAENYTSPGVEYVGFLDTDAVFVSRVALHDVFDEKGRPVVRPLYGMPLAFWDVVPKNTYHATGRKSPFFCMTYFPVVVKLSHLALLREHIRKHMNTTFFDEAFLNISRTPYSQFDIICNYLWYYQRDSYHWVIGQRDPNWTGPVPEGQVENLEEAGITKDQLERHGPHLAIHWNYAAFGFDMSAIFKMGICYALVDGDPRRPDDVCPTVIKTQNRTDEINPYEWTFEWANLNHNKECDVAAHRRRLAVNDKFPIDWEKDEIARFFKP